MTDWLAQQNPNFAAGYQNHIQNIPTLAQLKAKPVEGEPEAPILRIPVVVHIIHDPADPIGTGTNLSIAQIQSQINQLNEAFRQNSPNFANIPSVFQAVAQDAEIEFCLANIAPNGSVTNGITRHSFATNSINSLSFIETNIKPATQWQPANYLNIWTVAIPNTNIFGGMQGYAYAPVAGFAGVSPLDGVVVDYRFFGTGGNAVGNGLAAVREVAHYFGLLDIWGLQNANGSPIGCASDDGLNDTPPQAAPTGMTHPDCPSNNPSSCGSADMFPNYMDYMRDQTCQAMFTNDQVNVMRAVLIGLGATVGLGSRNGLIINALTTCQSACNFTLTTTTTPAACAGLANGTATVSVSGGVSPYNFHWNTSPVQNNSTATGLAVGVYEVSVTDGNGCLQIATANVTKPSTLTAIIATTNETCTSNDGTATVTVSGGTPPYLVTWQTSPVPQIGNTAFGLSTGVYPFLVSDAVGCTFTGFGLVYNGCSAICDTVFYAPFLNVVTPNLYVNPYNGGFLSGTNGYQDLAMSNYTNYLGQHSHVLSFLVGIGIATSSNPSSTVEFVVWEGAGGTPGAILGTKKVLMSTLAASIGQPFEITFDDYVAVGNEFFVGFKIPNPSNGDTLALGTSSIGDGIKNSNVAWTQRADGSWHSFLDDWHEDIGLAVLPILGTPAMAEFSPTNVTACVTNAMVDFSSLATGGSDFEWYLEGASNVSPLTLNPTVSYAAAGLYDAALMVTNGCITDTMFVADAVTVNVCLPNCDLYAVLTQTNATCNGGNNGSATVQPMDGTAPYSVLWSTGETTNTIANLSLGTYTVTVTDAAGCSVVGTVHIQTPDVPLVLTLTATDETCLIGNDGSANLTVTGGIAPYTLLWNNNATSDSLQNLSAGSYAVTVTDANNCIKIDSITVAPPSALSIDTQTIKNITCVGNADGSAKITVSGGSLPYVFNWSNGGQTDSISNLNAGAYTVTVTDAEGCELIHVVHILPALPLGLTVDNLTNVHCFGEATGSVSILPTGGQLPYDFAWSNGKNTAFIDSLAVGSYTVVVTDSNSCTTNLTVTINEPSALSLSTQTLTNVGCAGSLTGSGVANGSGGVLPYLYFWSNNTTGNTLSNVSGGVYTVTLTDANNCSQTDSVTITEASPLVVTLKNVTHLSCIGGSLGGAQVEAQGGVAPYSYLWSNNSTSPTLANVIAGNYTVTATDANNCTQTLQVTINQSAALTMGNIDTTFILCAGDTTGGFSVTPIGGTAPYTYLWNTNLPADTTNSLVNISAGVYVVVVTDASNCSFIQNLTLTEPLPLSSTMIAQNVNCFNGQTGAATISVAGGTQPYVYNWNIATPTNSPTISGLTAGWYAVTVTDANNCQHIDSIEVYEPYPITLSVATTPVACSGGVNGTATATAIGGVSNFTYLWDGFQTGVTAVNLVAGLHNLVVTDGNGCQQAITFVINAAPSLIINSLTTQPTSCNGSNDGSATVQVTGGLQPYTYSWNTTPPQNTATATGLSPGNYNVLVTDASGCLVASQNITVTQPAPIAINVLQIENPFCKNSNDGLITVVATNGTPSYTYQWSNGDTLPSTLGLGAGNYTVTVTDANGCFETLESILVAPTALTGRVLSSPASCFGNADGSIFIDSVAGGVSPYFYSVDGISFYLTTFDFMNMNGGSYTIFIKDNNGCLLQKTVSVYEPPSMALDLGDAIEIILGQTVTLDATINAANPLTYTWSNEDSTVQCLNCPMRDVSPSQTSTYTVSVVDTNGCTTSDDILIRVIKERRIFVPNVFTPNGDGYNDLLVVHGGSGVEEILQFKVFDRWGEMVYSANNFAPNSEAHAWDGTFKGKPMSPNVFVYLVEVRFSDGITHIYKGDITLLPK